MLVRLIKNELVKFFRVKQIVFLVLATIIIIALFYFNKFSYVESMGNSSYQEELETWYQLTEIGAENEEKLAPYQKEIYQEYKSVIAHRIRNMEDKRKEENNKAVMKAYSMDSAYTLVGAMLFVCSLCIPAVMFAGEYSNKTINQTLLSPCKRNSIYLAKIIAMCFILFCVSLFFYFVMQLLGVCVYGTPTIKYAYIRNGQIREMSFYLYYLGITVFQNVQTLAVMFLATLFSVLFRKKIVTILYPIIIIFVCVGVTKFGDLLGLFWVNFVPTRSFDLSEFFLRVPLVGEIDKLQVAATKVIDSSYGCIFAIIYDCVLLLLLYLSAHDKFVCEDIK